MNELDRQDGEEARHAQHYIITGRVQGVGFRWHTRAQAKQLGLKGWVRNQADGSVEAWAEGAAPNLERFGTWLHAGPAAARVNQVHVEQVLPVGAQDFEVRR